MSVKHSAEALAFFLGGELVGHGGAELSGIAPIEYAGPDDLTFFAKEKFRPTYERSSAGCTLVEPGCAVPEGRTAIRVESPYYAFAVAAQLFYPRQREAIGVSDRAFVDPSARLGQDINVFPGAYIGPDVIVGDGVDIGPNASLGRGVKVGRDCQIHANVSIYPGCEIGERCILHSGAVIGADGFGFAQDKTGKSAKITHVGRVVLEDDVEVGANSTIDRAVFALTRIGKGTKIDNLVMVAHNCDIGENCILVAQSGISGSTRLGDRVILAGQAGVVGHLKIGSGTQVGAQAGVMNDQPEDSKVVGSPAWPAKDMLRIFALWKRLPEWQSRFKELEKRLLALEAGRAAE